jgi:hypothetical protein
MVRVRVRVRVRVGVRVRVSRNTSTPCVMVRQKRGAGEQLVEYRDWLREECKDWLSIVIVSCRNKIFVSRYDNP